jgi:hypothetical protein
LAENLKKKGNKYTNLLNKIMDTNLLQLLALVLPTKKFFLFVLASGLAE